MRVTEPNEHPKIIIHEVKEHGYAHCHVGEIAMKVYVFSDGIVPEENLHKKDLKFIYGYYGKMIAEFKRLEWEVVPCPAEYKDKGKLFRG